jgi:hypothetical protein
MNLTAQYFVEGASALAALVAHPRARSLLAQVLFSAAMLLSGLPSACAGAEGRFERPDVDRPGHIEDKWKAQDRLQQEIDDSKHRSAQAALAPELGAQLAAVLVHPDKLVTMRTSDLDQLFSTLDKRDLHAMLDDAKRRPHGEMARFTRDVVLERHVLTSTVRDRLLKWLKERKRQVAIEGVRALGAGDKWRLDTFIRKTAPGVAEINFDVEVRMYEDWQYALDVELREVGKDFPARTPGGSRLDEWFSLRPDQHEAQYQRRANAAYIAAHPPLARLESAGWNLDFADGRTLGALLRTFIIPLPGHDPVLTFFVDPRSSKDDALLRRIADAWRQRSDAPPLYLLDTDVDAFMRAMSGRTVILVGHISGAHFILEPAKGGTPLLIPVRELYHAAEKHGVVLASIGCNSALAGAPFGFTRPITPTEVANFVAAIPRRPMTIGDLFVALGTIGVVHIDGTRMADHIDGAIRQLDDEDTPAVYVRIPGAAYAGVVAMQSASAGTGAPVPLAAGYEEFVEDWMAANLPFYERGVLGRLGWILRNVRGAPVGMLAIAVAGLHGLSRIVRKLIARFVTPTWRVARIGGRLSGTERYLNKAWIALALADLVYVVLASAFPSWPLLIVVLPVVLYIRSAVAEHRRAGIDRDFEEPAGIGNRLSKAEPHQRTVWSAIALAILGHVVLGSAFPDLLWYYAIFLLILCTFDAVSKHRRAGADHDFEEPT